MVKEESESANRPDNTAFTQQRLPAWQPILSAGIVIPGFVLIGLAFIGIGVALFVTSRSIQVLEFDYTGYDTGSPCFTCAYSTTVNCKCSLNFTLSALFQGPVFFYYGLSNYFQNYRKYGTSKDDNQLYGDLSYFASPSSSCAPYNKNGSNIPIVPCGSIANSMFNDTFTLSRSVNGNTNNVPLDGKGIAWWTDYNIKYRNPSVTPLQNAFNGTVKPTNWPRSAYELDTSDPNNNGFVNQDFLVWMRRAALPNFRKLYRRIYASGDYQNGLPAGNYTLDITYTGHWLEHNGSGVPQDDQKKTGKFSDIDYPVRDFNGAKNIVFSNLSWMGGKNEFLGIAYLVIGSMCIVMSVVMLIVYAKFKFPDEE